MKRVRLDKRFELRLSDQEYRLIKEGAIRNDCSISEWIRYVCAMWDKTSKDRPGGEE
jgi:hypothetical protein